MTKDIGNIWRHLYKFFCLELGPLSMANTKALVEAAVAAGNIQSGAGRHVARSHRLTRGNPRILEELLVGLSARHHDIGEPFGPGLLDLDRRIHDLASESAAAPGLAAEPTAP